MKQRNVILTAMLCGMNLLQAQTLQNEDGHQLWLRYQPTGNTVVNSEGRQGAAIELAAEELRQYAGRRQMTLHIDPQMADDDGYRLHGDTISARRDIGLLYGAFALLRGEHDTESHPACPLRLLNHWDNLDGSIERGYAGRSIFWDEESVPRSVFNTQLIHEYARANASIGINGTVLNNVNASPKMLTAPVLAKVKTIADILRPYGIRVYLSVNFASPMALGDTKTADPLDKHVARWWQRKAKEIYQLIPDFGGFLVKANSEGQPGPGDYHRSHADGANMLADALQPFGGIVMWRCFVYGANHKGEDRVKQAVSEFKPLDGKFRSNVILQTKNGPLDFQPREPYSPIFDQIRQTPNMVELQITQEYLGQSRHLVYLAPMWQEFFSYLAPLSAHHFPLRGIVGVANIGLDRNWCGHHFSQANWYAFGRMAWNPQLTAEQIAREWIAQTWGPPTVPAAPIVPTVPAAPTVPSNSVAGPSALTAALLPLMLESREACVNYMMPLGLHHIFKFDHHYGPEPDGFKAEYPLEWCPVYYHQADRQGIGFDRSSKGTDAVSQYRPDIARLYDDVNTCPENLLLWFHHVPWSHRMKDGSTLWQSLQYHYNLGVITVEGHYNLWHNKLRQHIDPQRWQEVDSRLAEQVDNAREWRDTCLGYFAQFAE